MEFIITLSYGTNRTFFPAIQKRCRAICTFFVFLLSARTKPAPAGAEAPRAKPRRRKSRPKRRPQAPLPRKSVSRFFRADATSQRRGKTVAEGGNARADGSREEPKPAPTGRGEGAEHTEEPQPRGACANRQWRSAAPHATPNTGATAVAQKPAGQSQRRRVEHEEKPTFYGTKSQNFLWSLNAIWFVALSPLEFNRYLKKREKRKRGELERRKGEKPLGDKRLFVVQLHS